MSVHSHEKIEPVTIQLSLLCVCEGNLYFSPFDVFVKWFPLMITFKTLTNGYFSVSNESVTVKVMLDSKGMVRLGSRG